MWLHQHHCLQVNTNFFSFFSFFHNSTCKLQHNTYTSLYIFLHFFSPCLFSFSLHTNIFSWHRFMANTIFFPFFSFFSELYMQHTVIHISLYIFYTFFSPCLFSFSLHTNIFSWHLFMAMFSFFRCDIHIFSNISLSNEFSFLLTAL